MKEIAEKLKALRLENRLTLKQLGKKAGCTDAYLSQLERGHANPSIMTLKKIATALGARVVDFFLEQEQDQKEVVFREPDRVNINFNRGDANIQMLVRNVQNKRMQPFFTTIEPGGGSGGSYSHAGEEFGIVLQGILAIQIEDQTYKVKKNESFYFSSFDLHSWWNPGKRTTTVIWVVSPPSF
jgi:transcriptional regulator with XRE-family HTH domain